MLLELLLEENCHDQKEQKTIIAFAFFTDCTHKQNDSIYIKGEDSRIRRSKNNCHCVDDIQIML